MRHDVTIVKPSYSKKKNSVDIIGLLTSTANINRFLCHHRGSKFSSRIVYFELRWLIH